MKVYLVHLEGQGDTDLKIVDKETFDWINSDLPEGWSYENPYDSTVPDSQKAKMKKAGADGEVEIYMNSYDNDRALAAYPMDGYDSYYDSICDVIHAIKSHGDELEDEYNGYIY